MGLNPKWVYFDACIVIYLIEQSPGFVENIAAAITREPDIHVCVSPLVEMECLVGALKQQDRILHSTYEQFFNTCHMLDIQASTFRLATKLRADYGIKTPDALHLATAIENDCGRFWTNDKRLNRAAGQLKVTTFSGRE